MSSYFSYLVGKLEVISSFIFSFPSAVRVLQELGISLNVKKEISPITSLNWHTKEIGAPLSRFLILESNSNDTFGKKFLN